MTHRSTIAVSLLAAGLLSAPQVWAQTQTAGGQMPNYPLAPQPPVPTIVLVPGNTPVPNYAGYQPAVPPPKLPEGFAPLFNGADLSGWHISKTARHGHTPDFHVMGGVIVAAQQPYGQGGLLITDKGFRDYELYAEAKADWGADSGIFLRTTEEGAAYQVTLDYLPGGSLGRVIQEGGLVGVGRPVGAAPPTPQAPAATGPAAPDPGMSAWKPNEWNSIRIRIEGDVPHVQVWINGVQTADFTDTANHAVGGMTTGPFALQVHGGDSRWQPGAFWRWRNIGVRVLGR